MTVSGEAMAVQGFTAAEARRLRLLNDAILPTVLRLAAPTVLILFFQVLVGVAEVYFIGFLGTDALAGTTLAFPVLMMMQMASNGGIGAGVSSAVARAVGAGRHDEAEALVIDALVLGAGLGGLATVLELTGGRALFRAMGGEGPVLDAALAYADVTFAASVLIWVVNLLTAALRGAGDTLAAAVVTLLGVLVSLPVSPVLIFGWGPVPAFGVTGAALGMLGYYVAALAFLAFYMRSPRCPLRLRFVPRRGMTGRIGGILAVGVPAALAAMTPNLSVGVITAAVGTFGSAAIAGFGLAARLDFALSPLLFGLGSGIMIVVGASTGAGLPARAKRAAWLGTLTGAVAAEAIGLTVAAVPALWLAPFTGDAEALAVGVHYLRVLGPLFGVSAASMLFALAAQGAGVAMRPLIGGLARLAVGAVGGWIAVTAFGADLGGLFLIVALGVVTACAVNATTRFPNAQPG
jgi:putative MATE family efflux protein